MAALRSVLSTKDHHAAAHRASASIPPAWPTAVLWAPYVGALVGALLLTVAYKLAVEPGSAGWRYPFYWAGMLAAFLPAAIRLTRRTAATGERVGLIVLLGAITYLPKLLRGAGQPVFTDEMLHLYQAGRIAAGGGLFVTNPLVPAISHYPMFDWLMAGVHLGTGLSVWTAGVLLVGVAHIALLFGVRALAMSLTGNQRIADLAVVIFATAPAFEFHTVMVSYESLGICLAVWAVALTARAIQGGGRKTIAGASAAAAATSITHALSALFLLGFLTLCTAVAVIGALRRRPGRRRELLIVGCIYAGTLVFNTIWVTAQGWNPFPYLFPTSDVSLATFASWFTGHGSSAPPLFGGSGLPPYEVIAGLLSPVVITALCALGFLYARLLRPDRPDSRWIPAVIYMIYPVTFLGRFNQGLGEVMHRSWPFLYVGIAILAAFGAHGVLESTSATAGTRPFLFRRLATSLSSRRIPRYARAMALMVSTVVLLVGNTATSANDQYRFPGPWVAGADTRSSTPEMVAAADWLRQAAGPGARILSDKDTEDNFLAYAWAIPVLNVPAWDLTETTKPVSGGTLKELYQLDVQYVVVDLRMATSISLRGYWYGADDPLAFKQTKPFTYVEVTKLSTEPWAERVYASQDLQIYRIIRPILAGAVAVAGK